MEGRSRKRLATESCSKPLEFSEDIIAPISIDDLAVQKAKLTEVQGVFQQYIETHRGTLLIIFGPSGSGKTATVKVLCTMFKLGLSIWRSQDIISNDDNTYYINPTTQLVSYLKYSTSRSNILRIPGIRPKPKTEVVLIDSLPYMHTVEQKDLFRETLRNVTKSYDKMIVINISDTSKSYVERLFGFEILQKARTIK